MNTDKIYNIALHAVAQIYGISEDAVRTGRNPNAMYARHMMYYVLHEEYGFSYRLIGNLVGKSTASVGHGVNKMRGLIGGATNANVEKKIKDIIYNEKDLLA